MPKMSIFIPDEIWEAAAVQYGGIGSTAGRDVNKSAIIQHCILLSLREDGVEFPECPICQEVVFLCKGHPTSMWTEYNEAYRRGAQNAARREQELIQQMKENE